MTTRLASSVSIVRSACSLLLAGTCVLASAGLVGQNLLDRVSWSRRLVLVGVIAVAAVATVPQSSQANTERAREYLLKAAFVYNFAKFVDWPATAFATDCSPLIMCIHGHEAFAQFAAAMKGKSIANRPIEVFDAHRSGTPASCHLAFAGGDADADAADAADAHGLVRSEAAGVLTVSDARNFVRGGGMVGLITVDNKMRFEVNLSASRKAGIRINAVVLRLAKSVLE